MESKTPAKVILFGEHAVVYGKPAIAVAINIYSSVIVEKHSSMLIDGIQPDKKYHSYILKAYELSGVNFPVSIRIRSSFSQSSGLGSSASITVGTVSSLLYLIEKWSKDNIARIAFETEYQVQGRASPIDTSTVTLGGAVMISPKKSERSLWKIEKNGYLWWIERLEISELDLIVANSGIRSSTAQMVSKVNNFVSKNKFGMEIIDEIGKITEDAIAPLKNGDLEKIGNLMNRNNKLLNIIGVGHESTTKIIENVIDYSYGAKITGAGGGGAVVIIPRKKEMVIEKLESMGIKYYEVKIDNEGVSFIK